MSKRLRITNDSYHSNLLKKSFYFIQNLNNTNYESKKLAS